MFSLLTEPLIRIDTSSQRRIDASLPEVYAGLMSNEVETFPSLRPHQRHAWHAFLVQLGAMAMHHDGLTEPPAEAAEWYRIIRALTADNHPRDEPWQLVVNDITRPAFMQPPANSTGKLADYKTEVGTPDELDMLVTSKNHDLKSAVAKHTAEDDWLFALITLQTTEGFGGRSNYGISRMPSGYGNRSAFSFAPSTKPSAHVKHDLVTLLKNRESLLGEYPMTDSGIGLLWVIPWEGAKSETLLIDQMEPYYIEICRRVRLCWKSDKLSAIRANSNDRRISDAKGLVGDPWMPVGNNTNPKGTPPAFLGRRKFGYERVVDGLTSPDWKAPLLLKTMPNDKDTQLVARGVVRGEGRTEGYHERIVPLREKTRQIFGRPGGAKELEDIARERIEQIGIVQRGLRYAISVFAAGGKTDGIADEHRARANPWANTLGEIVDNNFFDALQDELEEPDEAQQKAIRRNWLYNGNDGVIDHASRLSGEAGNSLPGPSIQRYKAKANADGAFWGWLRGRNGLPDWLRPDPNPEEEDQECQNNSQLPETENSTGTRMTLFE